MTIQDKPILHGRDHMSHGPDPIPGFPDAGGDDVSGLIMATSPAGFWKLNESSGTTAADSSGNGHDMEPRAAELPPTWAQAAGPPGDQTALWPVPSGTQYSEHVTMTALTNNFTAGIWVYPISGAGAVTGELIGQGTPFHASGGSSGWDLSIHTTFGVRADFDNAAGIVSDAAPSLDTWYFAAVVRDAGNWKLYVQGLLQTATSSTSPGVGSTDTWIGNDGFAAHGSYAQHLRLSYGFITPSVVSGADLLAIYESGASGAASVLDGKVWTALGDGTAAWRDPTIEVDF